MSRRSMNPIRGLTREQLDEYNPEAFDCKLEADGSYTLIPVRWMNQEEYFEVEYGCGEDEGCEPPPEPSEGFRCNGPFGCSKRVARPFDICEDCYKEYCETMREANGRDE